MTETERDSAAQRQPCPICGASTLVTKERRLRKHKRDTGAWRMEWCPGSGHAVL